MHRLKDRIWRLNNLYWIVNKQGQRVKFKPNHVQQILLSSMWFLNIVLKCRQKGVTTFWCIFALDTCLFNSNYKAGIVAHTREDAEEIFLDKVKYPYDNLGTDDNGNVVLDLKKAIKSKQDSARKLMFSNNSSIRVGTSLRSSTTNFLLITEHGKICAKYPEKAREIRTGSLNTVADGQMIVLESTAEGREGDFYKYCKIAQDLKLNDRELTKQDFKFFFFAWWVDPEYELDPEGVVIPSEMEEYFDKLEAEEGIKLNDRKKAWYVKKYAIQQDDMKQEFPSTAKEAFENAIIGAYYSTQMTKARKENRICFVPHNPQLQTYTGWDLGVSDDMAIWFFQCDGIQVNLIDYYENSGEGLEHYILHCKNKEYVYGGHYAPHDISNRGLLSGRTRIERAKDLGIKFIKIERTQDVVEDINEVRRIFNRFFIDESKCSNGIKCLDHYRKEWNKKLSCFRRKPLHDWSSNCADALRTVTHAVLDITKVQTIKPPQRNIIPQPQGWMGA